LDKIYVAAKVDYFHYEMEREILPWHKPSFSASISGKYNVEDKFWITADVFAIGKQYAKISEKGLPSKSYKRELKGIADINLGIEYLYNKRLNAFLKFNNLGGFRYYRWNNYPTQRFNLLAGISYSF
jgi:outer membrane receptor protein involved in Fe transport